MPGVMRGIVLSMRESFSVLMGRVLSEWVGLLDGSGHRSVRCVYLIW
jgi:hypothetical protein